MTFIDWSDPEDMFGLLIDYVTDERSEAGDAARQEFLSGLLDSLSELQDGFADLNATEQVAALRTLHRTSDADFANDPVLQHVEDCAAELERVSERSSSARPQEPR